CLGRWHLLPHELPALGNNVAAWPLLNGKGCFLTPDLNLLLLRHNAFPAQQALGKTQCSRLCLIPDRIRRFVCRYWNIQNEREACSHSRWPAAGLWLDALILFWLLLQPDNGCLCEASNPQSNVAHALLRPSFYRR